MIRYLLMILVVLWCGGAGAAPFDLIVCGSGGREEYQRRFADWGQRLRTALVERMHHPSENVHLLTESASTALSSRENVAAALDLIGRRLEAEDPLFVFLIGHGSYRDGVAKLNLPGLDLSAGDLDSMLQERVSERIVVVNAASASAPFINLLSAPGRVICTSTRSAEERNATWFAEGLLRAIEEGSADQNRDERISVLEACQQGAALTRARYDEKRLITTEHALIDDDGDELGSRLPLDEQSTDGALAAKIYLRDFRFPPGLSPRLIADYRAALDRVEAFIDRKGKMEQDEYYQHLEDLLVQVARLNREIRGGGDGDYGE